MKYTPKNTGLGPRLQMLEQELLRGRNNNAPENYLSVHALRHIRNQGCIPGVYDIAGHKIRAFYLNEDFETMFLELELVEQIPITPRTMVSTPNEE